MCYNSALYFLYIFADIFTFTLMPSPRSTFFVIRFGLKALEVALIEWDLLFPKTVFLPDIWHSLAIVSLDITE